MQRFLFFLGKGGVGKTTLSASLAEYLASEGKRVYISSLDPAHNLYDYFQQPPAEGVTEVRKGLYIEECSVEGHIRRLLEETSRRMKDTYRYLTVLNLEGMFDLLKHTPGMEEYGFISAIDEIYRRRSGLAEHLIVDMPPTGLSLRIFSMPLTTHRWIDSLVSLRRKILSRRREITHIKGRSYFGDAVAVDDEDDPVLRELSVEYRRAVEIEGLLKDRELSARVLVINYDELSLKEAMLIIKDLKALHISVDYIVCNKAGLGRVDEKNLDELKDLSGDSIWVDIPYYGDVTTPREYALEIGEALCSMMNH